MRILHVTSGNLYGGVETLLATIAHFRLLCPEMESHFAVCFEGRLSTELRAAGVPVYFTGNVQTSHPWTVLQARRELRGILERLKFDVMICHMPWSLAMFGAVPRGCTRLAFWMHGWTAGRHWLDRWAKSRNPDLAICSSRFTASALPNLFPAVPSEMIHYPVALGRLGAPANTRASFRRQLSVPDEAVVIIQVSRMESWKGHLTHLRALARLKHLPNWFCWFAGGAQRAAEREYFKELRRAAAEMNLGKRVRFLGQCSDVPNLLSAADIFCQPNERPEPFGIVFIEALLAGLPVVTSEMGGASEIVDQTCGLLVPHGNDDALVEALGQLIESTTLRARLASGGPSRARTLCDPETQLNQLREAFAG
jgi:glycosyltransferase involved in cell wall biosynthesis